MCWPPPPALWRAEVGFDTSDGSNASAANVTRGAGALSPRQLSFDDGIENDPAPASTPPSSRELLLGARTEDADVLESARTLLVIARRRPWPLVVQGLAGGVPIMRCRWRLEKSLATVGASFKDQIRGRLPSWRRIFRPVLVSYPTNGASGSPGRRARHRSFALHVKQGRCAGRTERLSQVME